MNKRQKKKLAKKILKEHRILKFFEEYAQKRLYGLISEGTNDALVEDIVCERLVERIVFGGAVADIGWED